ncbi:MAG TPA: hypothetical protein VGG88_12260 [Gaiellaceae bacterium]
MIVTLDPDVNVVAYELGSTPEPDAAVTPTASKSVDAAAMTAPTSFGLRIPPDHLSRRSSL